MLIRYLASYLMFLILEYSCLKKNFQHNSSHESYINLNSLYLVSNSSQSNGLNRTLRVNIYSHLGTRMFTTVSPFLLALGGKLFYFLKFKAPLEFFVHHLDIVQFSTLSFGNFPFFKFF
jgi:hypothetical protein